MNTPPEIVTKLPPGLRTTPPPTPPVARRRGPGLPVALFFLTLLSALYSQTPMRANETWWQYVTFPLHDVSRLLLGLPFAVTLMAILLAHEMGHYLTARAYGVDQSAPFFIPAPTFFGTLGAVIFMRSQPPTRRVLLHVAVMGPYAGMVLALPAAAWGLAHSVPIDPAANLQGGLEFGDSILFSALEAWFSPNGTDVILHPVATAGWVGLFITSLNLIPAAQLDGGHVAYAMFGKAQEKISLVVVMALLCFGLHSACVDYTGMGSGGVMWILWALLLFVIGIRHPPVQDEAQPLRTVDKLNGAVALLVFVVTFIPVPVRMLQPDLPEDDSGMEDRPYDLEAPPRTAPWGSVPLDDRDRDPNHDGDEADHPAEEFKL